MVWSLDIAEIDATLVDQVGGKAVNLGVMAGAGLPVPTGFCVTTAAYRQVVGRALDAAISELGRADLEPGHPGGTSADRAAALRTRVCSLELPDALRSDIIARYRGLGPAAAVAVRSSATAEDLPDASFAGQQDTFLNVVGEAALLDAVRRCWASLWTDRAVSYRSAQGIEHRGVELAVVVQQLVPATVAGVMFTANPVTGARHETVLDASPGLGEAVVSGAVNPDHFVVDRRRGEITERRLADKRVVVVARSGGGTEQQTRPDGSDQACLTDRQVLALTRLGQQVEDLYGCPQDTEWALDPDGVLWLTQARPVTTLYPRLGGERPVRGEEPGGVRVLLCVSLAQGLTRPITPMGFAAFRLIGSSVARAAGIEPAEPLAGPQALHSLGQRVYLDITGVLTDRLGRRVVLAAARIMEARAAAVLTELVRRPDLGLRPNPGGHAVRPVGLVLIRTLVPLRLVTAALSPRLAGRLIGRFEARLRAGLAASDDLSAQDRLDLVERRLGHDLFLIMPRVFGFAGAGFVLLGAARRLLGDRATPVELQQVQRSLPHNVTTEMDLELWRLASTLGDDPGSRLALDSRTSAELAADYRAGTLPGTAQRGLAAFLVRYGHRAVAEIDLGMPRWREDPEPLLGMLQNYRRSTDPEQAPDRQFARGAAAAEAMIDTLTQRAGRGRPVLGRLRGRLVGVALRRGRELAGRRETPKFLLVLALAAMREHLQAVGRTLQSDGRIARADDVFLLDLGEARRGLGGQDLRQVVERRRAAYATELRRRHIPRVLLSDGTEPEAVGTATDRPDGSLLGTPASAGLVTGTVRVVLDPAGAHLEPGEVLVAPSTDPGWTPLFLTAGALVMEMGGPNSHGAVVAREYGIPAVVGVADATRRLTSGQRVQVDGAVGLVSPVAPEAGPVPVGR